MTIWRMRIPKRRIGYCVLLVIFTWGVTILNMTYMTNYSPSESEKLKFEIINLSEQYVRALARENGEMVDGPYAGRFTAYDLKRTMAVLLESIIDRLNRLEYTVGGVINGTIAIGNSSTNQSSQRRTGRLKTNAKDLILGNVETCVLTPEDKQSFPNCEGKMMWMKQMWKSDLCYAKLGVDGSDCSFLMYLSEVEGWCPRKAWRGTHMKPINENVSYTVYRTDMEGLMKLLVDPNERHGYAFIRQRISRMWSEWMKGINNLAKTPGFDKRIKRKVLVHLGLLSKQSGWKIAEMQFRGGPLGELVQWSDLIATLYILGHQLTITSEVEQLGGHLNVQVKDLHNSTSDWEDLKSWNEHSGNLGNQPVILDFKILSKLPSAGSPCQNRKELPIDLLYTDIVGLRQFRKKVQGGYAKFSCLLRVVDSFGTEPAFNHRVYARAHKILSVWGGQDLKPQQFFTMFPHTPDNSFMGFVVEQYLGNVVNASKITRKNQAVVYGKQEYMWKDKKEYLGWIRPYMEIRATVTRESKKVLDYIPDYVINHGILSGEDLHRLLRQTKIFIGMGFPYEGPAALEAIANGAVFLNPSFHPPHNSQNHPFFKGKPTLRAVTSQHPYAETFIREPFVYTIDINNKSLVQQTIHKILQTSEFTSYLPYEYTQEGMLQRMNAYIEHQNFCLFQRRPNKWPPDDAMTVLLADLGVSCKDYCFSKGFICEPSHFISMNSKAEFEKRGTTCASTAIESDIYHPSVDGSNMCRFQKDELLFSCAGGDKNLRRLCPCRSYMEGQIALCKTCS